MVAGGEEKAVEDMLRELHSLIEQRDKVQARIVRVEAAARALIDLVDDAEKQKELTECIAIIARPPGLTEIVKYVVREKGPLTTTEVRDEIIASDFPLSNYSNPFAVVYTTLHRLQEQGIVKKNAKGEFEWANPGEGRALRSVERGLRRIKGR